MLIGRDGVSNPWFKTGDRRVLIDQKCPEMRVATWSIRDWITLAQPATSRIEFCLVKTSATFQLCLFRFEFYACLCCCVVRIARGGTETKKRTWMSADSVQILGTSHRLSYHSSSTPRPPSHLVFFDLHRLAVNYCHLLHEILPARPSGLYPIGQYCRNVSRPESGPLPATQRSNHHVEHHKDTPFLPSCFRDIVVILLNTSPRLSCWNTERFRGLPKEYQEIGL